MLLGSDLGGASSVGGCFSRFQQQTRAKSLVRMCSEISANSPEFSKGIFRNVIPRFEFGFLSKPFSEDSLIACLGRALGRHHSGGSE